MKFHSTGAKLYTKKLHIKISHICKNYEFLVFIFFLFIFFYLSVKKLNLTQQLILLKVCNFEWLSIQNLLS